MRGWKIGMVCLIVASGATIIWWLRADVPQAAETRIEAEPPATNAPAATPAAKPADVMNVPEPQPSVLAAQTTAAKTDGKNPFRVDASGQLVLDEQTRLNMEALFAQTDRADLADAQRSATAKLPPAAAAEAAVLLERYDNYSQDQRQSYPPGVAPVTEEAALAELEGLHALRVAHFGPEVATAFYATEEQLTRSLLDLMRLEKDQSLTLQEKAERAQKLHDEIEARQRSRR